MHPVTKLTRRMADQRLNRSQKLVLLCETIFEFSPECNRVGLWHYNELNDAITNVITLDHSRGTSSGDVLNYDDAPLYFEQILSNRIYIAESAREMKQTQPLAESYLIPNDIYSLLDLALFKGSKPMGILCLESVGKSTCWFKTDVNVIKRLSTIASKILSDDY